MTERSVFCLWYRSVRNSLVKFFGGKCGACDMKLNRTTAQFAHLKPTQITGRGRGSWERLHDVMANPTSYALLCYHCHREFDQ